MNTAQTQTPIIDAHLHLWEGSRFALPWVSGILAQDFTQDDYAAATEGLNVERAIYVETGVAAPDRTAEAQWILALQNRDPRIAGAIISGDPEDSDFPRYIARFAGNKGLCGVRLALPRRAGQSAILADTVVQAARLSGDSGLCVDLLLQAEELEAGAVLAERCNDTRFVLNHCGSPGATPEKRPLWQAGLRQMAKRPNVACKISGIGGATISGAMSPEEIGPIVAYCAEIFGPERLLFGSDWPVSTLYSSLAEWVTLLQSLVSEWSDADQKNLFGENAVRIYKLPLDS